jgi:hypothetical protein
MQDWEDWGLAIGISAILLGCCVFTWVKGYKSSIKQNPLLDNPV